MRAHISALIALIATPVCAHAASSCPIEHAHYALRGRPDVTADLLAIPKVDGLLTNVVLRLQFAKDGDKVWGFFDQGSARFLNLISTTDATRPGWHPDDRGGPLGEMHIWFADAKYELNYNLPTPGSAAPQHMFLPDLEEWMWYRAEPRRSVPTAYFDLISCQ